MMARLALGVALAVAAATPAFALPPAICGKDICYGTELTFAARQVSFTAAIAAAFLFALSQL